MDEKPDIRQLITSRRRNRQAPERQRPVVLACDTSTTVGSAALVEGGVVTAETMLQSMMSHSLRIIKDIDAMLTGRGLAMSDVDAFVTAAGPGSFTGVRIAMSTMKGLAWSMKKPLISIGTLHALAEPLLGRGVPVLVALDAKRQEVYAALFDADGRELVAPVAVAPAAMISNCLQVIGPDARIICAGEGVDAYDATFDEAFAGRMTRASAWENFTRAAVLGVMGTARLKEGRFADVETVEPVYLRRSEAEISLENRTNP